MIFLHEKIKLLDEEHQKVIAHYKENQFLYDKIYDLCQEFSLQYPDSYITPVSFHSLYVTFFNSVSFQELNDFIDSLEEDLLDGFDLHTTESYLRLNHMLLVYTHLLTNKTIDITLALGGCQEVPTGRLIEETKTVCSWAK